MKWVNGIMSMCKDDKQLDAEWVHLILKAKEIGLTIDEVKTFLKTVKTEAK